MQILIIKQTSLGDVLHSTGVVRALKRQYPEAEITLLTSVSCAPIYAHNPDIRRLITVDRDAIKDRWKREPGWVWRHVRAAMREINDRTYDLALDLQGLAKSVVFLYFAKARKKWVKGRYPWLQGFRNKNLHAIEEMAEVARLAGVDIADWQADCRMVINHTDSDKAAADELRSQINNPVAEQRGMHNEHHHRTPGSGASGPPAGRKQGESGRCIVLSPFTRWTSKNWPLAHFVALAKQLAEEGTIIVLSGAPVDRQKIDHELAAQGLEAHPHIHNIAGSLSLPAFAEFLRRADFLITGDSFPMHLSGAVDTPVLALFGPTDESKTGPLGPHAHVIRAPDCQMCDQPNCENRCLKKIRVDQVMAALKNGGEYPTTR